MLRFTMLIAAALAALPAAGQSGADGTPPPVPQFVNALEKSGIGFVHESGSLDKDYIIEVNGSGVGLLDYDADGDLDLFFLNGSYLTPPEGEPPTDRLYRNEGGWRFTDVTEEAGVGGAGWGFGCAAADYDNDGDTDLYVTNWGKNHLYRNNGDGTFTDVAGEAGVDDERWGASCAFGDYDLDGDLDLYVTNYLDFDPEKIPARGERASCTLAGSIPIHCGPKGLDPVPDVLYRNNGDGTFTDVGAESGIAAVEDAFGLGVFFLDYNLDGLPDLYVANDVGPNYLFENIGDGTFEEVGLIAGVSYALTGEPQSGMGVDCADLDGDLLEDIVVLNYSQDYNTFYRNDGDGFYTDISKQANLYTGTFHYLGWGLVFPDADFDGDLDLFFANGHVIPQVDLTSPKVGYRQRNQLFLNDGKGRFEEVTESAGPAFAVELSSRGCAMGDLDGDGDLDIAVNNMNAEPTLYENTGPVNHWLGVDLEGAECNRNGFGAWVTLRAADGTIYKRYHRGAFGYASQSEFTLRFGLGAAEGADWIEVEWPGGGRERFPGAAAGRTVKIKQGGGGPAGAEG